MSDLGQYMYTQAITLRGRLDEDGWKRFLRQAVEDLEMTCAGEPAVWRYPTEDGKGGLGMTICQPLTESFMVADTWPDHDGAYLHISSCRRFSLRLLESSIEDAGLQLLASTTRNVLALQ